jgi:hypothetical protein
MAYQTYTVKSGDSLSRIAQQLGLSSWQDLYNLNKGVIGANPNLIYAGQTYNIPGTQAQTPAAQTVAKPVVNPVVDTARQYTDPLTGQLESASEIPQFENVMTPDQAWSRVAPGAMQTGQELLAPELERQYNQNYYDYMNQMSSAGGGRLGRGLAGQGELKAASERNWNATLQDWLGQQRQGFNQLFYEPSRNAWNQSRLQVQPGETLKAPEIPTWADYQDKYGSAYGAGESSSLFY